MTFIAREHGVALVLSLLALLVLTALGGALVFTTNAETLITTNHRNAQELFYAADAGIEIAISDLRQLALWNAALAGAVRSAFIDGPPVGVRVLADGTQLDLAAATAAVQAESDRNAVWGPNNPRWQLYAHGPLTRALPPARIRSDAYLLVWLADDQADNDENPFVDTNAVVWLHAEARGPSSTRKVIEATVARRAGSPNARVVSWREVR